MKKWKVNRIKGLEWNVCLYIKYQPDLTSKRIISMYRLNAVTRKSLSNELTLIKFDSDSGLPMLTVIKTLVLQ